jgi:hypothetical protein
MLQHLDDEISKDLNDVDLESCMIIQESIFKLDSKDIARMIFTDGVIYGSKGEECFVFVNRILFDTGALHHSYINKDIVERNFKGCCDKRRPVSVSVKLGDNDTCIRVTEAVTVKLSLVDSKLRVHEKELDCYVWSMPGTGMIIGLPDILFQFTEFFQDMISFGQKSLDGTMHSLSVMDEINTRDIVYEGSRMEETEEERNSYEPCSFSLPLAHMGKQYDEAVKEYLDMFPTHLEKNFKEQTPVDQLLKSEWVMDLFVPKHWDGLHNVEPVEINFKSTLPVSLKPKARPINPRLHDNAKKEYERLTGYIYVQSTSPIASCLVVAPKATIPYIRLCGDYRIINQHVEMPQVHIPMVQHELDKAQQFSIFLDLDLTNAFHQIPIGERTSNVLSIQTPWS